MKIDQILEEAQLSDQEFRQIRSDQEEHLRTYHLKQFKGRLVKLLDESYDEAWSIGGDSKGPGICKQLEKIANKAIADVTKQYS